MFTNTYLCKRKLFSKIEKMQSKIIEASAILKSYKGENDTIRRYKWLYENNRMLLTEDGFETKYILENHDYEKKEINKTVKISSILGESLREKYSLDFTPEKLRVYSIIGEMGGSYHIICKFRQSMKPTAMFIKRKYILTNMFDVDYESLDIDFSPYNEKLSEKGWEIKPHQETAVKFLVANKKCILADSMGLGKALTLETLIPTPKGYKTMGEIEVGDKVFGTDGKPYEVTATYRHDNKPIYNVSFTDGSNCKCCSEHLWYVRDNSNANPSEWKVMPLKKLIEDGLFYRGGKNYKYEIPIAQPVEYEAREHIIHPYLIGIAIGLGKLRKREYTLRLTEKYGNDVTKLNATIGGDNKLLCDNNGKTTCYSIVPKNMRDKNRFKEELGRLKLDVKNSEKFIPDEYKYDSIENRLELLAGIMDSYAVIKEESRLVISTFSKRLGEDISELITSLGGLSRMHQGYCKRGYDTYMLYISLPFNPFSLKHRKEAFKPKSDKFFTRKISNIEYITKGEVKCITVNSPDSCYLCTNRYIVTHNTVSASVASLVLGRQKVLIITTASLKSTWKRELRMFVSDDDIFVIKGRSWDGDTSRFTIINYDIVQNYYEIPYEDEYKTEIIYGKNGEEQILHVPVMVKDKKTGEMVHKKVKSRKKADIQKCLLKSPLFQSKFDCVIIDEAQKLSNNDSNRYKVIRDFLAKAKIPYVFLVTGTPLTNTPMNLYHILKLIDADITKDYNFFVERYCDGKEMLKPGEWNKFLAAYEHRTGQKWATMSGEAKKNFFAYVDEHGEKLMIGKGASHLDELRESIKHIYIRRLSSDIPGMVNKFVDTLYYDLDERQKAEYDRLWDEYVNAQIQNGDNSNEEYRQLVEGMLVRQFLANEMVENTIGLVNDYLEDGEKVIIVCNFTSEIEAFKKKYGKKCVVYDGKMTPKAKDKAEKEFMENPKIKVFIGQEVAMSVGLTLTAARYLIFNSYSWSAVDNLQAQDRIYRLSQKRDAMCIYQLFNDSISKDMFEKVMKKELIMKSTIVKEDDKEDGKR